MENRDDNYVANDALDEEVELLITEFIEEIEENEEIKVAESVEIDEDFEYGVGLDVCLNVEEIDDEVVEKFIADFLADQLNLDKTLYSFTTEEDEE
jgi:spore cortex formation protein SpoVR/YcgB (stage V sporulation)